MSENLPVEEAVSTAEPAEAGLCLSSSVLVSSSFVIPITLREQKVLACLQTEPVLIGGEVKPESERESEREKQTEKKSERETGLSPVILFL